MALYRNEMMREHECDGCSSTETAECSDPACLIVSYRPERKRWCAEHSVACVGCGKTYCAEHADGWVVGGSCGECALAEFVPQQELHLEVA